MRQIPRSRGETWTLEQNVTIMWAKKLPTKERHCPNGKWDRIVLAESGAKKDTVRCDLWVSDCTRFARNLAKKGMKYASENKRPFFPTFRLLHTLYEKVPPFFLLRIDVYYCSCCKSWRIANSVEELSWKWWNAYFENPLTTSNFQSDFSQKFQDPCLTFLHRREVECRKNRA